MVLGLTSLGQSRVLNGGFENYSALPNATGQFDLVDDWTNAGSTIASPDFYHLMGEGAGDLPQTPLAKVSPFEGEGVVGFIAYTEEGNPRHEYVTGKFSSPLEVGTVYKMSFVLTSGRVHDWVSAGLGVSGLGIQCSLTPPNQQGYERLSGTTQFVMDEAFYNNQWSEVSFVFTAEEAFPYFTFGLFEASPSVRREETGFRDMAYYFVDRFMIHEYSDEVALEGGPDIQNALEDLETSGIFVPNAFTPDDDALNDIWEWTLPDGITADLVVFNRTGDKIWSGAITSNKSFGWDGSLPSGVRCNPGVYPWTAEIMDANGENLEKRRGFVAVVR